MFITELFYCRIRLGGGFDRKLKLVQDLGYKSRRPLVATKEERFVAHNRMLGTPV